ncbi:macrophage mannose receptor 1-like [Acanthochromis polyacanthus]|uniref:macrophage mannose receptor 1-like n=1 Tax=Acanthochromis polyacanthus TaxID=80966 RepID=UPI0022340AB1|nr:macrophage mannose receptor 1-like [Acanthochromis polyacanthus]
MERVLLALWCLSGWFVLPSCPLHQYYFVNQPLTWHEAQTYCRERFTDLATVHSMTEMNQLIDTVSSTGYFSPFWIGAFSEINWKWSDGSEAEYRHWGSGQPNSVLNDLCVTARANGWLDVSCLFKQPFVCYKGTKLDPEFVVVNESMTWSDAQKYCRENYIDLATVRNDAENQRLGSPSKWIGLSRDANSQWSDGSSFSFSYWDRDGAGFGSRTVLCGAAGLYSSGKWSFWYCEKKFPFICHNPFGECFAASQCSFLYIHVFDVTEAIPSMFHLSSSFCLCVFF